MPRSFEDKDEEFKYFNSILDQPQQVVVNVEWYKAKRELSYLLPAIGWYEGWGAKLDMECPESMWQRARELTETLEQESKNDDRENLNP